jgi:inner membrane protein involved in colicin E2 resistance
MIKNIVAISFIYICVCISWFILGNVVMDRSYSQTRNNGDSVEQLWGAAQTQNAPELYYFQKREVTVEENGQTRVRMVNEKVALPLASSDINVNLQLQQRKKGLLWYPTYKVAFSGSYQVKNPSDKPLQITCAFTLPAQQAVYDNLKYVLNGDAISDITPDNGIIRAAVMVPPHEMEAIQIGYDSQGMNEWRYSPGTGAAQVRNFKLDMTTDFDSVDFPQGSRSPTAKEKQKKGWQLAWNYDNTVTGSQIGMVMPKLLNPGPWVGQVTYFAPVSLFFFFFAMWLITTIKSIRIHPMHYFFIGAAFFSFHLLLAYSVDQIPVELAFVIASAVSIFLVLTYISRAVPDKRFFVQVGLAQFFYLIFFSFTFFVEQFTGLIITCMSICTLFLSMQYTARFDWNSVFSKKQLVADPLSLIEEGYSQA